MQLENGVAVLGGGSGDSLALQLHHADVRPIIVSIVECAAKTLDFRPTNLLCLLNLSQQIIHVDMFQNVVDRQNVRADADVLKALARRASQRGRVIVAKGHTILGILVLKEKVEALASLEELLLCVAAWVLLVIAILHVRQQVDRVTAVRQIPTPSGKSLQTPPGLRRPANPNAASGKSLQTPAVRPTHLAVTPQLC